jgi:hydrogenase maturation factor
MGDAYLVAKTDPITHVTGEIGHYAVHINANDIAAMGGTPLWFMATVLMPVTSTAEDLAQVFSQLSRSCNELGVAYCGGHTEVTSSVSNPVVIGQMLGEVVAEHLKPSSGAREGDLLIMTKSVAIEGTAIIALEKGEELKGEVPGELIMRAKKFLHEPGISVVKEAAIAAPMAGVHALHDPTEGGIATGVFELAFASGLGVELMGDRLPMREETRVLCARYGIDPLGTFASGSLLMAVSPDASNEVIHRLRAAGIPATGIGVLRPKQAGMRISRKGSVQPLPVYHQDELSKIFG